MKEREHANRILTFPEQSSSGKEPANEAETIGPSFDPALAELAPRYQVLALAGQGGMGVVYRARDLETGEQVALKVLKPDISADEALIERFKNELRLSHRITHKNVCRIYEFNRTPKLSFITMEFVDGESLRDRLSASGQIELKQGLTWALQLCDGLKEAHDQGIVHRDLKPENVMIDRSSMAKIMDFGIARSLEGRRLTSTLIGTPAYMAPEQAEGLAVDTRADIYAVGLMLYEMFTGVPAFEADTPVSLALKQVREHPRSPRQVEPLISPRLSETILKCLEKDPQRRFSSIDELKNALVLEAQEAPHPTKDRSNRFTTPVAELPNMPRPRVRLLLGLIQIMYLSFYFVALTKTEDIIIVVGREIPAMLHMVLAAVFLTGLVGIAVRLYLLSAVAFDFIRLGENFRAIFLPLLVLDLVWAFSPLLLAHKLGLGLSLALTVTLMYLPFSQRTLVRMGYAGC